MSSRVSVRMLVAAGLALLSSTLWGCTPLRMAVPSDVEAGSEAYEATGRARGTGLWVDESFRIGPFSVAEVNRAATRERTSRSWGLGSLFFGASAKEELEGGYTFRFVEGEVELRAACSTFTNRKKSSIGSWDMSEEASRMACTCENRDSTSSIEVFPSGRRTFGSVSLAGGALELTSVHDSNAGGPISDPVGFRVDRAEGAAGAVEVMHPGQMWLSKKLDPAERRELGCLLTGLMLYVED